MASVFCFPRRKITWKGTTPLVNDLSLFISGFGWKGRGELILTGKDYRTFQGRWNLLSNGFGSFQNLTGVNTLSPSSCTWCHLRYNIKWPPWGGLHLGAAILTRWVVVWRGLLYVHRPTQRNGSVNLIFIIIYGLIRLSPRRGKWVYLIPLITVSVHFISSKHSWGGDVSPSLWGMNLMVAGFWTVCFCFVFNCGRLFLSPSVNLN